MEKNYAFIDSQNLNLGIQSLGWKLDFERFRKYLEDKYAVSKAYLFIGYVPGNESLYAHLQQCGYICIFKPTLVRPDGSSKGNCDAELVLHAMIQFNSYDFAVLVTGDGDFHCLAEHLRRAGKLAAILIPNHRKFSALLNSRKIRPFLCFISDLKEKVSTG